MQPGVTAFSRPDKDLTRVKVHDWVRRAKMPDWNGLVLKVNRRPTYTPDFLGYGEELTTQKRIMTTRRRFRASGANVVARQVENLLN